MTSKRDLKFHFATTGLVLALSAAGASAAATLPKEGRFDVRACATGTTNRIDFSKTHWAQITELLGTAQSNPPGGFGDGSAYRCVGVSASVDGKASGTNYCEIVDQDGDKRFSQFLVQDGKTVRSEIAGTGKYDGIVVSSDFVRAPAFPTVKPGTVQQCNRQTGTYKMK